MECGVPQGSVSGPLYYIIYSLSLDYILRKHGLQYHFHVDDNQDYLLFKVKDVRENIKRLSVCLKDIQHWLLPNMLTNNEVKTEFSVHGTPQQLSKLMDISLDIDGVNIYPKSEVRNLIAIFDVGLTMKPHVKSVCKSAYFELHNINSVRRSLTKDAAATAIHAFITSRLDVYNSLLYGLPKVTLCQVQRIQNSAADCFVRAK